jgi:hypothetical protein
MSQKDGIRPWAIASQWQECANCGPSQTIGRNSKIDLFADVAFSVKLVLLARIWAENWAVESRDRQSEPCSAAYRFAGVPSRGSCVMPEGEAGSVVDRFAKLGVSLNGVIVPGRSIESVLARHALSLVINNEGDETFKLSLPGSATAIRYRGHDLMLITQHQLKGVDESQVAMLTDDGSRIITSSGRRGYDLNPERETQTMSSPSISQNRSQLFLS